jgi:hypothetical protein
MGIDRVVMFLTDSTSEFDCLALPALRSEILNTHPPPLFYSDIKEVLLFPAMKPLETAPTAAGSTSTTAPGPSGQV